MSTMLARRSDPATSLMAAEETDLKQTIRDSLMRAFDSKDARLNGLTVDEAGQRAGLLQHNGYWKRMSDLLRDGYLCVNGIDQRPGLSGRKQQVHYLTMKGLQRLRALRETI